MCCTAHAKQVHLTKISEKLDSVRSPTELWKFFRSLTPRPLDPSASLDVSEVERHFTQLFHHFSPADPTLPYGIHVPELDSTFSLAELDCVLNKCKPDRQAGGNDGIKYELLSSIGVSNKIIRILSVLYRSAKVIVGNGITNPISYVNGVLQEDCLSPLLFALFIYRPPG